MRELPTTGVEGVRVLPDDHSGVGALVLTGSSGRVDADRARLLAEHGALSESIRWFGGEGQHAAPFEIPLELFLDRVARLRQDCDRVVVAGTSFGAEAALLTGALCDDVTAVVAFAPSDVVWAGVTPQGRLTSHWTYGGVPLPFVPFDDGWQPDDDPPSYVGHYLLSRERYAFEATEAAIPVERIREVILVAGGDDQVWPAVEHAGRIRDRRAAHNLPTTLVTDAGAGHRTVLPNEPVVTAGSRIRRGGTDAADRRLGQAAWEHVRRLLG